MSNRMSNLSVPSSVLRSFEMVPPNVHVSLLLRHSHRRPIKFGSYGIEIPLTPRGVRVAEELGSVLGRRQAGRILASPVPRCVDTGMAVALGAGWSVDLVQDRRLGDPGPFVVDTSLAGPMFLELGSVEVARRQLVGPGPLPGMRPTQEGVLLLVDLIAEGPDYSNTLDVLVTHDAIIAVVVGYLLGVIPGASTWPKFLDGPFVWRSPGGLGVAWMGTVKEVPWPAVSLRSPAD
jgi:broad specificity phosphatase PhoE